MPSIKLMAFAGMRPRVNRALLRGNEARHALNVNLWHGTLEGYRVPLAVDLRGAPNRSIHLTDAGWLAYPGMDDFVSGLPGCPRIIATGEDFPYPVWASADEAVADQWHRLGLPVPPTPTASPSAPPSWAGPEDQSSEWRAYVITYVDRFDNEGPPSLPSERFAIDDSVAVGVEWPAPPAGWDIQAIRLYRLVASDAGATEIPNPRGEGFHLVAEMPANIAAVTDTTPNLLLGAALTTIAFAPPPEELDHLCADPNGTGLAGAQGRNVWFCEPHQFHAWPDKYRLTLDDAVVAMAWTVSGVYVVTTGKPYWIAPNADEWGRREVYRMPEPMPCVSRRSLAVLPSGAVMYAHGDGLAALQGRTQQIVSEAYWGTDDFRALNPASMVAVVEGGCWFGFTDQGGWMLDVQDSVYPGQQLGLIALSLQPTALHRPRTDSLYLALPEGIARWNAGTDYLPWAYRGRCNVAPGHMNWSAAKIVWDEFAYAGQWDDAVPPVEFTLWHDDRIFYQRPVTHSNPFRLPHGGRALDFEAGIARQKSPEKGAIREIHLASSAAELTE